MRIKYFFPVLLIFLNTTATAQVTLVKDFKIGPGHGSPSDMTIFKNKLYLYAYSNYDWQQVWSLDSVNPPSIVQKLVSQFSPPAAFGPWSGIVNKTSMIVCDNKLYFSASDKLYNATLWEYDGVNNFKMTPELFKSAGLARENSMPMYLTILNQKIYFTSYHDIEGWEIWVHDPATGSNKLATNLPEKTVTGLIGGEPIYTTAYNDRLYFGGRYQSGHSKLISFAPASGYMQYHEVNPVDTFRAIYSPLVFNNVLYFIGETDSFGRELYYIDRTSPLPVRISNFVGGIGHGMNYSKELIIYKNNLYFAAGIISGFQHLCKYDPFTKKITLVYDKINKIGSNPDIMYLGLYKDRLVFTANDGIHGAELWSYDGMSDPLMIADINPGNGAWGPRTKIEYAGSLYFEDSVSKDIGWELYKYTDPPASVKNALSQEHNFILYPNPTSGYFNIELGRRYDNVTLEVVNILGQPVLNKEFNNIYHVHGDITGPAGIYIVHVRASNGHYAKLRIVKQ